MGTVIVIFLRLLLLAGILGGLGYLATGPGRRLLERALGREPPFLKEARDLSDRIEASLREAPPAFAERLRREIAALVEERLPAVLKRAERLRDHLRRSPGTSYEKEVLATRKKLESATDESLRKLLARNLELARHRWQTHQRMGVLLDRTEAQLDQVLLYLRSLETRVLSLSVPEVGADLPEEMVHLLDEVSLIEEMYREMDAGLGGVSTEGERDGREGEDVDNLVPFPAVPEESDSDEKGGRSPTEERDG